MVEPTYYGHTRVRVHRGIYNTVLVVLVRLRRLTPRSHLSLRRSDHPRISRVDRTDRVHSYRSSKPHISSSVLLVWHLACLELCVRYAFIVAVIYSL